MQSAAAANVERWWRDYKKKKKTEVILQCCLSFANQTWAALGSNQGSDDARQANIRLGYSMAYI
jgi:hypothetical protein